MTTGCVSDIQLSSLGESVPTAASDASSWLNIVFCWYSTSTSGFVVLRVLRCFSVISNESRLSLSSDLSHLQGISTHRTATGCFLYPSVWLLNIITLVIQLFLKFSNQPIWKQHMIQSWSNSTRSRFFLFWCLMWTLQYLKLMSCTVSAWFYASLPHDWMSR